MPNAPRSQIIGWLGEALKVKVHAPPVEGKANEALCEFLAATFGVSRRSVSVVCGETSRQKRVHFSGLTPEELRQQVAALTGGTR